MKKLALSVFALLAMGSTNSHAQLGKLFGKSSAGKKSGSFATVWESEFENRATRLAVNNGDGSYILGTDDNSATVLDASGKVIWSGDYKKITTNFSFLSITPLFNIVKIYDNNHSLLYNSPPLYSNDPLLHLLNFNSFNDTSALLHNPVFLSILSSINELPTSPNSFFSYFLLFSSILSHFSVISNYPEFYSLQLFLPLYYPPL